LNPHHFIGQNRLKVLIMMCVSSNNNYYFVHYVLVNLNWCVIRYGHLKDEEGSINERNWTHLIPFQSRISSFQFP
jgi:hypothetical protein